MRTQGGLFVCPHRGAETKTSEINWIVMAPCSSTSTTSGMFRMQFCVAAETLKHYSLDSAQISTIYDMSLQAKNMLESVPKVIPNQVSRKSLNRISEVQESAPRRILLDPKTRKKQFDTNVRHRGHLKRYKQYLCPGTPPLPGWTHILGSL